MADGSQQMEPLEAIFGDDGMEAVCGEHGGQHVASLAVVLDDEDVPERHCRHRHLALEISSLVPARRLPKPASFVTLH